ncbi:MAG: NAD(P)/FAD-dependent oxidoreductase [Thermovirgaceae bacterium]|jgi:dihydrolipoamide dehydrogenase|nr:NAD(P)/FAD-dependent oxidoreductase [Synergistales bacterium]NMD17096.1 NAD(P)/FAD-dependent oxidoreductase [Synergistaceae bacterium]OQB46102.1 MAG: Dihydrolipoamide dehydrogenase [Synergistetes bacterium ADurb.Bin155]HQL02377.1 NAD(P)/FAD-dependent oxidoreductase [Synergistales bacterium]
MYDLVILGGGPGGLRAAELAAAAGMNTVLVEKDRLGGVCVNSGCIPTKALYASIIGGKGPREGLWSRVESVVDKLRQGSATSLRMAGVKYLRGTGRVTRWEGVKGVSVTKADGSVEEIAGARLLLATGARSVRPPFRGGDLPGILTGDKAITEPSLWDPERNSPVKTVAILGAGVIAVEMASLLQGLGKEVVLLKRSDQVLRRMDGDIKKKTVQILKKRGTMIKDHVRLREASLKEGRLSLEGTAGDDPFVVACDRLIIASSMEPVLDGFGLEESPVRVERGAIAVDPSQGTSVEGVYAVGDCTGGAMLAHLAEYQALAAVSSMTGGDYRVDYDAVPACVFMDPEVGALGLTEEEAPARGEEIVTAKAYFGANGMALALGESDGFVKVVARASDKTMLGVHIMGPEASSLLGEATLAVAQKLTAVDVARTVHAHPTLCECFRDACSRLRDGA